MKTMFSKIFSPKQEVQVYVVSIRGEGYDDMKAFRHGKLLVAEWLKNSELKGQRITILETKTKCLSSDNNMITCTFTLRYAIPDSGIHTYIPTSEIGFGLQAIRV